MTQHNHLVHWLAQEREVLAALDAGPGPGVATREQIAHLNGLQQMQAMLRGELPFAAIAKTLDFLIVEVDDGKAVFQGTPRPEHLNPMGTVHGGWFATLLDSALGCAVHTRMEPGRGYTTAELGINLVKAITPKVQRVRAEGRVIHSGRQLATAEARLVGPVKTRLLEGFIATILAFHCHRLNTDSVRMAPGALPSARRSGVHVCCQGD